MSSEAEKAPATGQPQQAAETRAEHQAQEAQSATAEPQDQADRVLSKFKKDDGTTDYSRMAKSYAEAEKEFHSRSEELSRTKKTAEGLQAEAQHMAGVRQLAQTDSEFRDAITRAYAKAQGQPVANKAPAKAQGDLGEKLAKLKESGALDEDAASLIIGAIEDMQGKLQTVEQTAQQREQEQLRQQLGSELNNFKKSCAPEGLYDGSGNAKDQEFDTKFMELYQSQEFASTPLEDIKLVTLHRLGRFPIPEGGNAEKDDAMRAAGRAGNRPLPSRQEGSSDVVFGGLTEKQILEMLPNER